MPQKKPLVISAVILGAALLISLAIIFSPRVLTKIGDTNDQGESPENTQTQNPQQNPSDLPIPIGHGSVGQVFAHYFINGKITALAEQNSVITLDSSELPNFTLGAESRVSRISPPYNQQNSTVINKDQLKNGLNIIISAEFDLKSSVWIVRDVYIPTDKN